MFVWRFLVFVLKLEFWFQLKLMPTLQRKLIWIRKWYFWTLIKAKTSIHFTWGQKWYKIRKIIYLCSLNKTIYKEKWKYSPIYSGLGCQVFALVWRIIWRTIQITYSGSLQRYLGLAFGKKKKCLWDETYYLVVWW
jgi:hypothetical protein